KEQANCATGTGKCRIVIATKIDKAYSWWVHAGGGMCARSPQADGTFQTTCSTPTPTPTQPTPTPGALRTKATCYPNTGAATNQQTISANWDAVDSASSYQAVRRGGAQLDETKTVTGTAVNFSDPTSNTGTVSVSVAALNQTGQSLQTQSKTVTNAVCTGPPTATPTPPPQCTNEFGGGCIIGNPAASGCSIGTSQQNLWCQNINNNPQYVCSVCPEPPPPPVCNKQDPLNNAPSAILRADGYTVDVEYTYYTQKGTYGDIYRSDKDQPGFIPGGTQTGTQFGTHGLSFDMNLQGQQYYYYQTKAISGSSSNASNTYGVLTPEQKDVSDACWSSPFYYINNSQLTGIQNVAVNNTTITFNLIYEVQNTNPFGGCTGGPCALNPPYPPFPPEYLKIQRSSTSTPGYIPWVKGTGTCLTVDSHGACQSARWTAEYAIDLPPNTTDTFKLRLDSYRQ
ncbi:MAG: hypothetical protein HYV39_00250, partial [Candidatus Levybacteria bacterium]|nr:hypothetical protein [Candidatus Levybacteria bacterium]